MTAYFDSGFAVREPMWHGGGNILDEYPTDWADARTKAGLGWEPVELKPFFLWPFAEFLCPSCFGTFGQQHLNECPFSGKIGSEILPAGCIVTPDGILQPDPGHKGIARKDTHLVLGVRSDEYSTIYHGNTDDDGNRVSAKDGRASMEEIIDAFTGADGALKFETAGSCREGRQVWALLCLDEPFHVPGDESATFPFLALLNNHAGGACKAVATQVRVVCANTFQMASDEGDRTGQQFTFRHVGDVAGRIEEAKATIAGLRGEREAYLALAEELSKLNITDPQVEAYLTDFLPSPRENGEQCSDRVHDNVERARKTFRHIYQDSVTTDGIRGNGYGLLQASTEYLDHVRGYRNRDTYLGRSVLGVEPIKQRALQLIRSL